MSAIDIANPWLPAASLAVGITFLVLARRRSLAAMTRTQRIACLSSRIALIAVIALALADIRIHWRTRDFSVLFLVDRSASISASAIADSREFIAQALVAKPGHVAAGVAAFGRYAEVLQPIAPGTREIDDHPLSLDSRASDIGHALDFAAAILPAHGARRVVLLSDGNDTEGKAQQAAARLHASGTELWTVPLGNGTEPEVLVERVDIPQRLKVGEPFDLIARIRSNREAVATVKLYQNQFLIQQRQLTLSRGQNAFRAANLEAGGNFVSYEVEVDAEQDTQIENNRALATASLKGEPRVLVVDNDEKQAAALASALRANKIAVEIRSSAGAPPSLEDLQQFDLFILSDIPALQLGRPKMDLYRQWVQDFGGGFVMLGGENSYGVGGYYRTPIEQMLPVRMEHDDRQETPSVALLVVLDRSGSMTAQVQGQTKMSLANQGAVFAMNALQPRDQFGVLAVDTRAHTVTPLAALTDKASAEQKITTVTGGGGGIYIYTSLAEAFQVLRDVQARIKHVILFSDASDAEEKIAGETGDGSATSAGGSSLDLASAMLSARITTSVVALGTEQDKDTPFLRQLAERGSGRFYLTSDATTLPQIFSTETMKVAQSSLVEEPFQALPVRPNALTAGIAWEDSPLLLGYNSTKPKPAAEVLLASERGEPLLTVWRYGLGQAAAFTSDAKSRWASEWLQWPGYGKLWSQLVRGLMRKSEQSLLQVNTTETQNHLDISIDAITPEGAFRNRVPLHIAARFANGETSLAHGRQVAPGHYSAKIPLPDTGTAIVSVTSPQFPDGGTVIGRPRGYPKEFLALEPDVPFLQSLVKEPGRFAVAPTDIFKQPPAADLTPKSIGDWFLMAALLLLPLDIWLRRRTWG